MWQLKSSTWSAHHLQLCWIAGCSFDRVALQVSLDEVTEGPGTWEPQPAFWPPACSPSILEVKWWRMQNVTTIMTTSSQRRWEPVGRKVVSVRASASRVSGRCRPSSPERPFPRHGEEASTAAWVGVRGRRRHLHTVLPVSRAEDGAGGLRSTSHRCLVPSSSSPLSSS